MAFSYGPTQVTSVQFDGTTVTGNLIENLSVVQEPDSFDSAAGVSIERGSVITRVSADVLDYSAVSALVTDMTDQTDKTITITYADTTTRAISGTRMLVRPIVGLVTDACRIYGATAGTTKNTLTTGFTDLGPTLGAPSFTFEFPFTGTDGCGRPFFSNLVKVSAEFLLPGDATVDDPYDEITNAAKANLSNGASADIAILLPSGKFLVLDDVYAFTFYGGDDASNPRTVRLRVEGTGTTWASKLSYTDGGASGETNASTWGTDGSMDPGDYFAGCSVEAVGFSYDNSDNVYT